MEGSIVLGLVGLSTFFIVLWVFLYAKQEEIVNVVLLAYLVRCVAYALHRLVMPSLYTERLYPFERYGWEWASEGFGYVLTSFTFGPDFFSWLVSLVYLIFPRSSMLISSINIFMGSLVVYAVYKIVSHYTHNPSAKKAAILAALFPVLILQTIILSREIFITLSISAACLSLVKFSETNKYRYFVYSAICLLLASAPHTGILLSVLLALSVLLVYLSISKVKNIYISGINTSFSKRGILASCSIFAIILAAILNFEGLADPLSGAKIYSLLFADESLNPVYARYDAYSGGAADFPRWLSPSSPILMILFVPLRAVYFLFSPFIWMISEIRHIFGFINSLILIFLTYNTVILFNSEFCRSNASILFLALLIVSFIIVFCMATNNFGQAFRHRSKIIPLLISFGIIGFSLRR